MDISKAHCNKCGGERRHEVLHKEESRWEDKEQGIAYDKYEMLKCCGCETICLRHSCWGDGDVDEWGQLIVYTKYYPPAIFRQKPRWLNELAITLLGSDLSIPKLLDEIYVAIQNGSERLAVMGIRALLEHVMIEKVGDWGTFKKHLDKFEEQGFVSKSQRAILEPALEAGHATIHRAFSPSPSELEALIDITENIIEAIYLNQPRAKLISRKIPPRGVKKKEQEAAS